MLREEGFSAAHGNSLRALVKYLENLSDKEIVEVNIPTGIPLVYELDDRLRPVDRRYLGDPESAKDAGGEKPGNKRMTQRGDKRRLPRLSRCEWRRFPSWKAPFFR